jgi:hypothetical protein
LSASAVATSVVAGPVFFFTQRMISSLPKERVGKGEGRGNSWVKGAQNKWGHRGVGIGKRGASC